MKSIVLCLLTMVVSCSSTSPAPSPSQTSNQNLKAKTASIKEVSRKKPTSEQETKSRLTTPKCNNPKYTQEYFEKQGIVFGKPAKPIKSAERYKGITIFPIYIHTRVNSRYPNKKIVVAPHWAIDENFERERKRYQQLRQFESQSNSFKCSRFFIILKLGKTTVGAVFEPNQAFVKILNPGVYLQKQRKRLEIHWKADLLTGGFIHKYFTNFSVQIWNEKSGIFFERNYKMTWLCSKHSKLASKKLNLKDSYADCPLIADKKTIQCSYEPDRGFSVGYQHKCWK